MLRTLVAATLALFLGGPALAAVNINSASQSELESLPGIGPSKASAIVEDRTKNGPFASCDDLQRVTGIGAKTIAGLRSECTTSSDPAATASTSTSSSSTSSSSSSSSSTAATTAPSTGGVNINKASQAELESLPGIGPSKASAIIEDRTKNGPFASCDDLQRVTGIGAKTVDGLRASCTVQ